MGINSTITWWESCTMPHGTVCCQDESLEPFILQGGWLPPPLTACCPWVSETAQGLCAWDMTLKQEWICIQDSCADGGRPRGMIQGSEASATAYKI
jgi:hypothetical protein